MRILSPGSTHFEGHHHLMSMRVLFVATQGAMRSTLVDYLKRSQLEVIEAGDGIEGWKMACRTVPDVLVIEDPRTLYGGRALVESIRLSPTMGNMVGAIVWSGTPPDEEWLRGDVRWRTLEWPQSDSGGLIQMIQGMASAG